MSDGVNIVPDKQGPKRLWVHEAVLNVFEERNTLKDDLTIAKEFLYELVAGEDQPCQFDHHGYCQEHPGGFSDGGCITARVRKFLGI